VANLVPGTATARPQSQTAPEKPPIGDESAIDDGSDAAVELLIGEQGEQEKLLRELLQKQRKTNGLLERIAEHLASSSR